MKTRPQHAINVDNYAELRDDIAAFAENEYNFMIVIGANGLGKTSLTKEMVKRQIEVFEGNVTAWGFYTRLYRNRDATIIMDDVNPAFFKDSACNAYMKALTETRPLKTLRWQTASTGGDKEYPDNFETSSRVILLTNRWESLNEHIRALEGRAFTVIFDPPPEEVHADVARGGWFHDQEVYEFVWRHRSLITRPNLRLYGKIAEQKQAGRPWRKRGLEMLAGDRHRVVMAQLLSDGRYSTNKERAEAFTAMRLGGRTRFYEFLKEFERYRRDLAETKCPRLPTVSRAAGKS